jgi:hypothetical protein
MINSPAKSAAPLPVIKHTSVNRKKRNSPSSGGQAEPQTLKQTAFLTTDYTEHTENTRKYFCPRMDTNLHERKP